MKKLKLNTSLLASTAISLLLLTGCWTEPRQKVAAMSSANFSRSWYVAQTTKSDAVVQPKPDGMISEPTDREGKVLLVDRSYRLLTVLYTNDESQTFKVPLPDTLDTVNQGDPVVVRPTQDTTIRQSGSTGS
jgi:hypothetical protein